MAKESALPGSPLTSNHPASKYRCSWDLQADSVVNLIVPNYGLNAFLSDIKASKFCGVKLTYLYSGKMMLLYDLLIVGAVFSLLASCEYGTVTLKDHAVWRALLSAGSMIFKTIVVGIVGKLVLWDIGHWIPGYMSWIKSLREANDRKVNNFM